jgi:tRNA(fMet)-specific endonuclease VapC
VSDPEGLLDTSALLALRRVTDPSLLPDVALISAITLAELSVGPLVATDDLERARRLAHVQQAEADFDPIPFDAAAARAFGLVASAYRRSGRKPAARAFDALIAATAIANGLPLYTANAADFAGIDGLVVRAIPTPVTGTWSAFADDVAPADREML